MSVSVAELFAELVSTAPAGAAMFTVLASEPVAVDEIATVTEYVTDPLGGKVAVVDIGIVPLAAPHELPLAATHVHVPDVVPLGSASVISALVAVDGPAFDATIVYVAGVPGISVVAPSVLVTPRLTRGSATVAAVAELFVESSSGIEAGPATVAVFDSVPVNVDASVAVMVYVAEPPTTRLAVVLSEPVPLAAAQVEPVEAVHVHVAEVRTAGSVSVTAIAAVPDRGNGPLLVATTV